MKKKILCGAFLFLAGGCGSPSLACVKTACTTGSLTYQTCELADGSIKYEFPKTSCTCSETSASGCSQCTADISSYCGAAQ